MALTISKEQDVKEVKTLSEWLTKLRVSGWKNVLVRVVQLALFAVFMPNLFHHGVSDVWLFDTRLVMAAIWAAGLAWVLGATLGALLEFLQRPK